MWNWTKQATKRAWSSVTTWAVDVLDWLTEWYGDNADAVREVLETAADFVDEALPIVERLNEGLKRDLQRQPHDRTAILGAIIDDRPDGSLEEQYAIANRIHRLSSSEILLHVAIYLLSRRVPAGTPESMLRLAVELAYNVYKLRKAIESAK